MNSSSIWVGGASFTSSGFVVMESSREIRGEIRVHGNNFRDVSIKFLDQSNVVNHVAWDSRLVILIHLLNESSVSVEH